MSPGGVRGRCKIPGGIQPLNRIAGLSGGGKRIEGHHQSDLIMAFVVSRAGVTKRVLNFLITMLERKKESTGVALIL